MIILASASPRRKELLENHGIHFEVLVTNVDESVDKPLPPSEFAAVISKRKAASAVNICMENDIKQATVIAADTIVSTVGKILGKPKDREGAFHMLSLLENRWHSVYTGLCVAFIKNNTIEYVQDCCLTKVKCKSLTDWQIEMYINTGEPYDKAGAYGIQGEGGKLIEKIDGDYNNVVGLPIDRLLAILKNR